MSELGRWSLGVFFSVYLGDVEGFRGWRLGLSLKIETRVLADGSLQEFLHDVILSPHNPLRMFFRRDVVQRMIERTRHDSVSVGAYTFLWTVAIASSWLRVESGAAVDIDYPNVPATAVPSISC